VSGAGRRRRVTSAGGGGAIGRRVKAMCKAPFLLTGPRSDTPASSPELCEAQLGRASVSGQAGVTSARGLGA
jgi:hypothetical protein